MKIRLLVDMGGRWSGGAPEFDYRDGRRGDVFEVTEDAGARMVRLGYVTTDVALAGDKLPRPYGTPFWGGSPSPGVSPLRVAAEAARREKGDWS